MWIEESNTPVVNHMLGALLYVTVLLIVAVV